MYASGTPLRLRFTGDIASSTAALANFGTDAFNTANISSVGAIAPIFTGNPFKGGSKVGDKLFDLSTVQIPTFGSSGATISPFYLRTPHQSNWDISFFKNFRISEKKNLQFRSGFFNIFNQAFPKNIDTGNASNSDVYLTLATQCNVKTPVNQTLVLADGTVRTFTQTIPNGVGGTVSGVCDPSKGYSFTNDTKAKFGQILTKRGQRVVELALKFTF